MQRKGFKMPGKDDDCQHDDYCGLSKTVCKETDFKDHCRMKDTDIEEMHLLKSVKDRVERDKAREAKEKKSS
jgi:hypothetical protein